MTLFSFSLGPFQNCINFFEELNMMNTRIKLTMTHTTPVSELNQQFSCACAKIEGIPFLDTFCKIEDGQISTDLYRKPLGKVSKKKRLKK